MNVYVVVEGKVEKDVYRVIKPPELGAESGDRGGPRPFAFSGL